VATGKRAAEEDPMSDLLSDPETTDNHSPRTEIARCPSSENPSRDSFSPTASVLEAGAQDDVLHRVLDQQVGNMAIVTTCQRGTPVGVLVTSLASVSTSPPIISFSLSTTSWAWSALEPAEYIGVHLLQAGQEALAERFSPLRTDGFRRPLPWRSGPYGVPVLDDCATWTVAQSKQMIHTGGHVIIVARLLSGQAGTAAAPLFPRSGSRRQRAS
jgi:flavin reductase (DIM6/NTAB) family NADH-FMN oxidoreductase RutF